MTKAWSLVKLVSFVISLLILSRGNVISQQDFDHFIRLPPYNSKVSLEFVISIKCGISTKSPPIVILKMPISSFEFNLPCTKKNSRQR